MSYFPRRARLVVAFALACSLAIPATPALAADHPRPAARKAAREAREARAAAVAAARAAAAAEAARVRAAQAHALAVARVKLQLRKKKSVPKRASIVFDKNWRSPFSSRLTFRVWAKTGPRKWTPIEAASWRAGAGIGGRAGRDECARGAGWLPNGAYSVVQHDRRKAPLVNGRVFELSPHACRNGTLRQMLFIHTEQNWDNTQCRNQQGDDGCRWEFPRINDYRSYGCIKMSPGDLKALTQRFHRYFKADRHYSRNVVRLRVLS